MPACDMCGKEADLVKARIEGAEMNVCRECARFGKILRSPRHDSSSSRTLPAQEKNRPAPKRPRIQQLIVPDYADRIRKARERLGLNQEQFARKLSEKHSFMQKLEAGQLKPSIETARKLESSLKISLVEQVEDGNVPLSSSKKGSKVSDGGLTIADFIKKK